MTMDLISGLSIIVSVFMLACAILALAVNRPRDEDSPREGPNIAFRALATMVVVFFISAADLLLIAQQVSLALGTFVVGVLVVVLLFMEPSLRSGKPGSTKEDWRR